MEATADGAFCAISAVEYMRQANSNRFVALPIEDPEALEELDSIAAVGGYDILFFGPGDYSHAIGLPGQYDHPLINEARDRVLAAAKKTRQTCRDSSHARQHRLPRGNGLCFFGHGSGCYHARTRVPAVGFRIRKGLRRKRNATGRRRDAIP